VHSTRILLDVNQIDLLPTEYVTQAESHLIVANVVINNLYYLPSSKLQTIQRLQDADLITLRNVCMKHNAENVLLNGNIIFV